MGLHTGHRDGSTKGLTRNLRRLIRVQFPSGSPGGGIGYHFAQGAVVRGLGRRRADE